MYLRDSIELSEHTQVRRGKEVNVKTKRTLHHFQCNDCGEEFTKPKNGKMRDTTVHFCPDCFSYSRIQKETTKLKLEKASIKGIRYDRGYKEIFVGPDYPYRDANWVREHIVIIEREIGKRIPNGMVVHHIDGNKRNNKRDNLLLCTVSEHNNLHARIEGLVWALYKEGKVVFDKDTLEYSYVDC